MVCKRCGHQLGNGLYCENCGFLDVEGINRDFGKSVPDAADDNASAGDDLMDFFQELSARNKANTPESAPPSEKRRTLHLEGEGAGVGRKSKRSAPIPEPDTYIRGAGTSGKIIFVIVLALLAALVLFLLNNPSVLTPRSSGFSPAAAPAEEFGRDYDPYDPQFEEAYDFEDTLTDRPEEPVPEPVYEEPSTRDWLADLDYFYAEGLGQYDNDAFHELNHTYYDSRDNLGTDHERVLVTPDSPDKTYSQIYLLDGKYAGISGVFYLRYDERDTKSKANFSLYGDGKLLWSYYGMTTGVRPAYFDVDLTGVDELKLTMSGDTYSSYFGLGDVFLYTAEDPAAGNPAPTASPASSTKAPSLGPVSEGDIVRFGSYEQDNRASNGSEPIEWIVLIESDEYALLMSRYALDWQPYHTGKVSPGQSINWSECTLRTWLNRDFLNTAFSAEEQALIYEVTVDSYQGSKVIAQSIDRVFLPMIGDLNAYIMPVGAGPFTPTAYAVAQGARGDQGKRTANDTSAESGAYQFLLNSSGVSATACCMIGDSYGTGYTPLDEPACIRPLIWVHLN